MHLAAFKCACALLFLQMPRLHPANPNFTQNPPHAQAKGTVRKPALPKSRRVTPHSAVQPIQISSWHGPHARVKAGSFFNHPGVPGGPVFLPGNKVDHLTLESTHSPTPNPTLLKQWFFLCYISVFSQSNLNTDLNSSRFTVIRVNYPCFNRVLQFWGASRITVIFQYKNRDLSEIRSVFQQWRNTSNSLFLWNTVLTVNPQERNSLLFLGFNLVKTLSW